MRPEGLEAPRDEKAEADVEADKAAHPRPDSHSFSERAWSSLEGRNVRWQRRHEPFVILVAIKPAADAVVGPIRGHLGRWH